MQATCLCFKKASIEKMQFSLQWYFKKGNILRDLKIVDNSPGKLKRSRSFLLFKIKIEVDVQLPTLYVTAHVQAINYHVKYCEQLPGPFDEEMTNDI